MANSNKYFTSTCGPHNGNFLRPLGFEYTPRIEDAAVVIFGGGADVDPKTYNEEASSRTWASTAREREEKADFRKARSLGIACLGICRGVQLLTALAGGKIIQDVSGHGGPHQMSTFDGNDFIVNSIHHQMINPYVIKDPSEYKILSWSTKRLSRCYTGAKDKPIYLPWGFKEIEAIYFPKINSIGYQFHPEMMYGNKSYKPAVDWVQNTFIKFINKQL